MPTPTLYIDAAQVLIDHHPGPSEPLTPEEARNLAFAWALSDGTLEDVQRLLAEGVDPSGNCDGYPFLADCLYSPKKMRALLDAGANVHVRASGLLDDGEDVDDLTLPEAIVSRHNGDRASHRAKFLDWRLQCLKLLLEHGAPCEIREGLTVPPEFAELIEAESKRRRLEANLPAPNISPRKVRF